MAHSVLEAMEVDQAASAVEVLSLHGSALEHDLIARMAHILQRHSEAAQVGHKAELIVVARARVQPPLDLLCEPERVMQEESSL